MAETEKNNIYAALAQVQKELKAPKDAFNAFGKYKYRTAEAILRAAKPLCEQNGIMLTLSDAATMVGDWHYIESTATAILIEDPTQQVAVTTPVRESVQRAGMDAAQITGGSISYARKYALGALFLIDDTQTDPDATNKHVKDAAPAAQQEQREAKICAECGKPITDMREGDWFRPADWVASKSASAYGKSLCGDCFKARRQAERAQQQK